MPAIDTLLLKRERTGAGDSELSAAFAAVHRDLGAALVSTIVNRGIETADLYVYFELAQPREVSDAEVRTVATTVAAHAGVDAGTLVIDRLQRVFSAPGASRDAPYRFRYVVETDAADGWREELFRWYDDEHMPGLAAAPGCARAQRYLNHDRGPCSFACYDLVSPEVTASPPWLAVRGTQWSSRVRPQFRNTRRTMFRALALL